MGLTDKQKIDLRSQLKSSLNDLKKLGWSNNKIELLKKVAIKDNHGNSIVPTDVLELGETE